MTQNQIHTTIAESMGWTALELKSWGSAGRPIPPSVLGGISPAKKLDTVPSYTTDLNACAEFEATLTDAQRTRYGHEILLILERDREKRTGTSAFDYMHATAPQRCEAYLRTLNLWIK